MVDHTILLERLQHRFGFSGTVLKWFQSYLTDRRQTVHVQGENSKTASLSCGVPQGSVLGPILYSLYTAPVSDIIKLYGLSHQIYADDTTIYISLCSSDKSSSIIKLTKCLEHLQDWFNCNKLKLNTDKTEVMLCGSPFRLSNIDITNISVCGNNITVASNVKCLGVILNSELNLDAHILSICKSAVLFIRNLRRIRCFLSKETTKTVVSAFVFSRIDYCNVILAGCSSTSLQRLQRVLNCCARIIMNLPKYSHITDTLRELHWLPIHQRIQFKLCCLVFKCLAGTAPIYLKNIIKLAPSTTAVMNLRSRDAIRLHQPISKYTSASGAFCYSAPRAWNNLSVRCRSEQDYAKFKKQLKTELFNKYYSNIF